MMRQSPDQEPRVIYRVAPDGEFRHASPIQGDIREFNADNSLITRSTGMRLERAFEPSVGATRDRASQYFTAWKRAEGSSPTPAGH